ncbi:SGNH/GDSL hydrolase family protein [Candidatus Collierbacteria bacterium]|nr:SGNH/GDSL hydrolase family protein [Candidatus Collierbacteria bacterium]
MNKNTTYLDTTNYAILSREFDVIIIESFGHNPLSRYPLEQGLKIQTETLDHLVAQIADAKPKSVIIFLATIAPSQSHYAKKTVDLSPQVRRDWANERRFYIENHINYAKRHNIPLINVYEKSLDENGLALLKYINPDDYIHPSKEGIKLISQEISDFLFKNKILPQ